MGEPTRYDLEVTTSGYTRDHEIKRRADGEWMLYEDHAALIAEKDAVIAALRHSADVVNAALDGVYPDLVTPSSKIAALTQENGQLGRQLGDIAVWLSSVGISGGVVADGVKHLAELHARATTGLLDRDARLSALTQERDFQQQRADRLFGLLEKRSGELTDANDARAELTQERDRLLKLAYIDPEHRFDDATYEARFNEALLDLRAAREERDRLKAERDEARQIVREQDVRLDDGCEVLSVITYDRDTGTMTTKPPDPLPEWRKAVRP